MRVRTILTTVVAAAALSGALAFAPSASASAQGAPITWYQAVARASAQAPCPATSDADKAAGWTDWTSSWEQWPNDGKGGYVCTRAITWAYEAAVDASAGASNCVLVYEGSESDYYVDFGSSYSIPKELTINFYTDPACYAFDVAATLPYDTVWAPEGNGQADERCASAFPAYPDATQPGIIVGRDVWFCRAT